MADNKSERDVTIHVSPDRMAAELEIPADFAPEHLTTIYVEQVAQGKKVRVDPAVRERIEKVIAQREFQKELRTVIAEGTPALDGEDGYVEWLVDEPEADSEEGEQASTPETSAAAPAPSDEEAERVSYYDRSAFVVVHDGQKIGKVHAPTQGEDGMDVYGDVVRCRAGTPVKIETNESVQTRGDGVLVAQSRGVLIRSGNRAVIENQLEVNGYVDFSTGHIDFCGDVLIHKGIRDKFKVVAEGNVEVKGLIESAYISCTGTLYARGGFAGGDEGEVHTGEDLEARYLNDVRGEVNGDLRVDKELLGSDLVIHGKLDAPRSSVIGGTIRLVGQGEVHELGSPGGMATLVQLGALPKLEPLVDQLEQIIGMTEAQLGELRVENENLKYQKKPNAQQKERITEIMCDLSMAETRLLKARGALEALEMRMEDERVVDLTVHARLFPGVTFLFRGLPMKLKQEIPGPARVCCGADGHLAIECQGVQTPIEKVAGLDSSRDAA